MYCCCVDEVVDVGKTVCRWYILTVVKNLKLHHCMYVFKYVFTVGMYVCMYELYVYMCMYVLY